MKKIVFTILLIAGLFLFGNAKDYNTGVGLRGGFTNGFTIKQFIGSNVALEGIIASRWRGLEVTGLYEIHNRFVQIDRLNWYIGLGGHVGLWDGNNVKWGSAGTSYTVVGVDGVLGLEYSFLQIPINISIDWKPTFNFYGYKGFWADGGAISLRYIF